MAFDGYSSFNFYEQVEIANALLVSEARVRQLVDWKRSTEGKKVPR